MADRDGPEAKPLQSEGANRHARVTVSDTAARSGRARPGARYYGGAMAEHDETPLTEQLEEIGAQLDWVRGYL
jgi:hypothetical protein